MDPDFFKENAKKKNTTKSTNTCYRNYCNWAIKRGEKTDIVSLEKHELNILLENYFAEVTRNDGKNYEPTSLNSMLAAIDRYLKENGCMFSILKDVEFMGSRDVLEGKAKYLREHLGMGKKPNKSHSLTMKEENTLWQSQQLGIANAKSLTNTVWYLLTQHFGLRGRQEHHQMLVEDFAFKLDDDGNRFITFSEGVTKTRGGGLRKIERAVVPKMFETGDEKRCPVMIFEFFLSKGPVSLRPSGPLYLAIISNPKSDTWFKVSRLGVNSLDNIMKTMIRSCSLQTDKKLTNHSARKTVVKKLKKSGMSRTEIIEITGHSNEKGLDPYDSGDEAEQRVMSHAIDQASSSGVTINKRNKYGLKTFTPETLPERNFSLLSEEVYKKISRENSAINYNFLNCNVTISGKNPSTQCDTTTERKQRRIIYSSSDSSQEL